MTDRHLQPGDIVWLYEEDWDSDGTVIECVVKEVNQYNLENDSTHKVRYELVERIYPSEPDGKVTEKHYTRWSREELFDSMEDAIAEQARKFADSIWHQSEEYRKYCEQKRKAWDDYQTFLQQGAYI